MRTLDARVGVTSNGIFDLAIAATALANGIDTIYTYDDSVFGRVPGLRVLSP